MEENNAVTAGYGSDYWLNVAERSVPDEKKRFWVAVFKDFGPEVGNNQNAIQVNEHTCFLVPRGFLLISAGRNINILFSDHGHQH